MTGTDELPPALFLMGPTAAGKTAAALALHQHLPVRLISVDSAQVYRGLDIGSAKPDAATLRRHPHALIDLCEPEEVYSAARFAEDAAACMREAWAAGRWPVLAGGSMLYFRALLYGLDKLPPADTSVRRALSAEAERLGWPALHARLARADVQAAAAISPQDGQRIQRGLEILELTGKGPSHHRSQGRQPRLRCLRLALVPSLRSLLHERIAQRLDQMFDEGLVAEVEGLRARPRLTAEHVSMKCVGYRQVWEHLEGRGTLEECRQRVLAATRQLAKRQLTALRAMHGVFWHDSLQNRTIKRLLKQASDFFVSAANSGRPALF